jgi:hypothetical protein
MNPFKTLRIPEARICRADAAAVRAEDISYALGSLQIRQYDPAGNLRKSGE